MVVMQAADRWDGDYLASGGLRNVPRKRRVSVQRQVCSRVIVIGNVVFEDPPEVLIPENNQTVETLTSDRSNDSLSVRVLPRWPAGGDDLSDTHSFDSGTEMDAVDGIAVAE